MRNSIKTLKAAVDAGDKDCFKTLINSGSKINEKKTIFGLAPLHNAIFSKKKFFFINIRLYEKKIQKLKIN